jgi:uncharacterized protein (TIGR04255 family)
MGRQLKNPPVYFVIAQIRFNPILNLEEFIPAIQDKMRLGGFPDFKKNVIQQLVFSAGIPGGIPAGPSTVQSQTQFIFGNMAGTENYVLHNDSLSFQTTDYPTFSVFKEKLFNGIQIVHEIIQLGYIERVGLRYLDGVIPRAHESLSDYLAPEVSGLWNKLPDRLYAFCEAISQNTTGQLTARSFIQDGPFGIPNDLAGAIPKLKSKFADFTGLHAIIDNDASLERREAFSIETVKNILGGLKEKITISFDAMITPQARDYWDLES